MRWPFETWNQQLKHEIMQLVTRMDHPAGEIAWEELLKWVNEAASDDEKEARTAFAAGFSSGYMTGYDQGANDAY